MPPPPGRGGGRDAASARDQTGALATPADKARRRFTAGLIAAIEELEARRTSRPQQALADAAWHKLQFDLPLLEDCELSALLAVLSASFEGKAGWPCYQLTAKALENIAAGARGSGASHEPPLSAQEQAVQDALARALAQHAAAGKGAAAGSSGGGSTHNQQEQQPAGVSRQGLYQQLLAVLLLQYTAKVVSLPEADAWQLLASYTAPGDLYDAEGQGSPGWQQQHQGPLADEGTAAAAGLTGAGATAAAACVVYEDVEAAQQDEDSDAYEPLEPQQQHCSATNGHTQQAQQQQQSEPFSPQALVAKLLSLADHVHYSLLSHEPLWQQQGGSSGGGGGAAQHLLQLLRLLGVHGRSRELQPLLHACVGVLVDRLAAAPGDLPLLRQLWGALGLTGGAGSALSGGAATCGQRQQQEGLPPEAVLGFTVAAAVWQQLPGVGARRQLWQAMCDDLLPLLEQCTEQLAFSAGTAGTTVSAAAAGASFAHMLLVCHTIELLVLGRPAHADVAAQLTQLGVTRNLVTLFVKWGCDAAAEPLRRAVLLCSCASPSTAAWVLAVPQVRQQLQEAAFLLAGAHESHGVMWQLIVSSSSTTTTPAGTAAQVHQQQQLLALLQPPCDNAASASSRQLQRQVLLLQLMADAQRAAGSKQRLFDAQVLAALRKLAGALKDAAEASSNSTAADDGEQQAPAAGAAAANAPSAESDRASDDDGKHGGKAGRVAAAGAGVGGVDGCGGELEGRRSAQLQPAALRLIKQLMTQGGGKTD